MIKSMTAYSRASKTSSLGRWVVEIHSVNRKMLDMSLYLPKDLLRFDLDIRKWLGHFLERGQITLRLAVQSEGMAERTLSNYAAQLKGLKKGWEALAHGLGYDPVKMIDLTFLVERMQTQPIGETKEDEEAIKILLKELVDSALKDLMYMKEVEGKVLAEEVQKRLTLIEENATAVEIKKEEPLIRYRKKMTERLTEVGHTEGETAERVSREVALLAEKMDITEELVRLKAHIGQFRLHLVSKEKAIGRTLDFLTQEMHREINTLGSKSVDSDISLYVVKMKSELDKIREQVQNIE